MQPDVLLNNYPAGNGCPGHKSHRVSEMAPAVGWSVALTWTSSRRSCRRIRNPKSNRKVRVGTTKKSPHVLGHGELGNLVAEEAEFGLDPAPAPGRVFSGHAADQGAELKIERRATR
jgi:hypothetical protein